MTVVLQQSSQAQLNGRLMKLEEAQKGFWLFSFRFLIILLLCIGLFVTGLMRISIGMAMVCMVNSTALAAEQNEESLLFVSPDYESGSLNESNVFASAGDMLLLQLSEEKNSTRSSGSATPANRSFCASESMQKGSVHYDGELIWSPKIQGEIFSAFFYGSVISSLPAGWLADRYGPKRMYIVSVCIYIFGSLLTPIAAYTSYVCVLAIRAIMGIAEGMIQPCIAATIARWIPPEERSMAIAVYTAGSQLCMVVGMPVFAWLCTHRDFLGGWPAIYYFSALTAIPWCIAWLLLVTNSPTNNRRLSQLERDYIAETLKHQCLRKRTKTVVPWRQMLTSKALWACNISNFASSFAVFTLQSYLPTYFKQVLNLDLGQNGLYSSLPFLVKWVVKMCFGFTADSVKKRTTFNRTVLCKIFNSIGCFGCGLFFVACSFLDCQNKLLALVFLCIATGLSSGYVPGALTSAASLAPHYSGIIRSWSGLFNQLAGLAGPYIVAAVNVNGTREEWQTIFFIVTGILFVAGFIFNIFGSAELQNWAKLESRNSLTLPRPVSPVLVEMREHLLHSNHPDAGAHFAAWKPRGITTDIDLSLASNGADITSQQANIAPRWAQHCSESELFLMNKHDDSREAKVYKEFP